MYSSFFHGVWGGVGWGGVRGDPQEGDIEKIKQKLGLGRIPYTRSIADA